MDKKPDVVQYSADIVYDGKINEEEFAKILEAAGLVVMGTAWKATWTHDDYEQSKPPYSWD